MEDVIYILIGIAWVLYTVYNQNQKQKRKQAEVKTSDDYSKIEDPRKSIFEEKLNLEQMFKFDDPVEEYLDSPYSEIDVVEKKDETSYFKAEKEGVSAFQDEVETDTAGIVDEIKHMEEEDKWNDLTLEHDDDIADFDARKAVIFSEILNPPYIKN